MRVIAILIVILVALSCERSDMPDISGIGPIASKGRVQDYG